MGNCTFKKYCDKKWEELSPSGDSPNVRHCGHCEQNVFLTRTNAETALFSALEQCIAISLDHEGLKKIGWVGESDFDWLEEEIIARVQVVIPNGLCRDKHQTKGLRLLFGRLPAFSEIMRNWEAGEAIDLGNFEQQEADVLIAQLERWHIFALIQAVPDS